MLCHTAHHCSDLLPVFPSLGNNRYALIPTGADRRYERDLTCHMSMRQYHVSIETVEKHLPRISSDMSSAIVLNDAEDPNSSWRVLQHEQVK